MEIIKINGICEDDVNGIMNSLKIRNLTPVKGPSHYGLKETIYIRNESDPYDLNWEDTIYKIEDVLVSFHYEYTRSKEGYFDGGVYKCSKKYDSLYERCRFKDILNSSYGYLGGYVSTDTETLRQIYIRMNDKSFKMYGGIERATGKFKTTVVWSDGHRETVTATKQIKGYTPVMIFAYALAKKKFRTNSHFKRYVDNHTEEFGEFYVFYDNATYRQATVKKSDKKYDIYDMAALSIAIIEYGSLKKLEELVEEAMK